MKIRPLLTESSENQDDLTWAFRLRQGVYFRNSSAMEAEVVYSLGRTKNCPQFALKSSFVAVDSIFQKDERMVVVSTDRLYPMLLNKMIGAS